jgi:single-strand DNA-binding protein
MNKVVLVGRLTRDPEIRYANNEKNTCTARFSLAINRKFKTNGQYEADFPNCVAMGKTAEFVEKYFHKGDMIALDGHIQTGSYTNKDGNKVYTTDVFAENVEFAQSKSDSGNSNSKPSSDGFMNIPDGIEDELPFA